MKVDWGFLIIVAFTLPVIWLFGRYVFSDKIRTDYKSELLEVCEELIQKHTTESLLGVTPQIVTTGGGGAYGYSQPMAIWKNEEFDVDIQCLVRFFGPTREMVVDRFVVNGKNKTNLVRREERKE